MVILTAGKRYLNLDSTNKAEQLFTCLLVIYLFSVNFLIKSIAHFALKFLDFFVIAVLLGLLTLVYHTL